MLNDKSFKRSNDEIRIFFLCIKPFPLCAFFLNTSGKHTETLLKFCLLNRWYCICLLYYFIYIGVLHAYLSVWGCWIPWNRAASFDSSPQSNLLFLISVYSCSVTTRTVPKYCAQFSSTIICCKRLDGGENLSITNMDILTLKGGDTPLIFSTREAEWSVSLRSVSLIVSGEF